MFRLKNKVPNIPNRRCHLLLAIFPSEILQDRPVEIVRQRLQATPPLSDCRTHALAFDWATQ